MVKKRRVPNYRYHKARRCAVVTVKENGKYKDHYLGEYGSPESLALYDRLIEKFQREAEPEPIARVELVSRSSGGVSVSIAEICDVYTNALEKLYNRPTANSDSMFRAKATVKHLLNFAACDSAELFGPIRLEAFRDYLLEQRKGADDKKDLPGVPLSRGYINDLIDETIRIFRYAVSRELLHPDIPASLETLKPLLAGLCDAREPDEVEAVPDAIIKSTVPHLPPVIGDMVQLQRLIGARPGEVCKMTPGEIDRSGDVWFYRPARHKNAWRKKPRVIAIGPKAQAILTHYLDRHDDAPCFAPSEADRIRKARMRQNRKTPVQPSQRERRRPGARKLGDKYDTRTYCRAIQRACVKAGVEKWSPNRLRHATATQVEEEFDLETARTVLGHTSKKMTKRYVHPDTKQAAEVARTIG